MEDDKKDPQNVENKAGYLPQSILHEDESITTGKCLIKVQEEECFGG